MKYNHNRRRSGRLAAALLSAVMLGTSLPFLSGCKTQITMTVEAGDPLPNAAVLTCVDTSAYVDDVDKNCINHAGTYILPIKDADGNLYELKLVVRDRTKPVVTPRHLYCPLGTTPEAADFIGSIVEADDYEAEFVDELPDLSAYGDYDVTFRVRDASGNVSKTVSSVVTIVKDTEAPVFVTVPELSATIGDAIAYRQGLVVTDNCCGEVTVSVDSSHVVPGLVGDYPVYYTASDASGNTARAETVIHLYSSSVDEALLNQRVDEIIASIIKPSMNTEAKLREVYRYIRTHIAYVSDSDKSDWMRAAYDTLFVTGSGDCFDFFAAAKIFLIRLGVDYYEIQRSPGVTSDTHYWLLVNIGPADAPRWYHYDCTRLRDDYITDCLLTDKQVRAYTRIRTGFYSYDTTKYPASCTTIITQTPKLEPFY